MALAKSKACFLAIFPLVLFSSCSAFRPLESRLQPGLLLTFDDRYILHWEKQIPLFSRYHAHVTFFIDQFDQLTPEQITALDNLQKAGHAIGCHGLRHLKAAEFCEKYSTETYLFQEIVPARQSMMDHGFLPSCFAYPFSNHNQTTDQVLQNHFRHLRGGYKISGTMQETEQAFVKIEQVRSQVCLQAISFHPKSPTDDLVMQAKKSVERIKRNREILVLYAHDIRNETDTGSGHYITPAALEELLAYAASCRVKLYSFDEMP
jgi:peptidoglycan-N-acetylglucosamine deacetylase